MTDEKTSLVRSDSGQRSRAREMPPWLRWSIPYQTVKECKGPKWYTLFLAVALTVIFTVIVANGLYERALLTYRATHEIPTREVGLFFFKHKEEIPITPSMLGWKFIMLWVVVPSLFYGFVVHPLVGRLVTSIVRGLTRAVDNVFFGSPVVLGRVLGTNTLLLLGAIWPLASVLIPLLIIALILGYTYRSLWT